jgi:RecJ-like exonuclease
MAPELTAEGGMVITHRTFGLALAGAALLLAAATGRAASAAPQDSPGAGFAWAEACRDCHAKIYDAWQKTKHARAISRLGTSEQEKECINCHVTGGPGKIEAGGKFVNANVQCESCHGAAAAHAADPAVRTGLTRKPKAAVCEACHNEKSPHFRGFHYAGMLDFSHPVTK